MPPDNILHQQEDCQKSSRNSFWAKSWTDNTTRRKKKSNLYLF